MEIGVENNWKLKVGIFSEKCKYPASHCLWMGAHPNAYRLYYMYTGFVAGYSTSFLRWFVGLLSRLKTIVLGSHRATTWLPSQLLKSRQCFPNESKSAVHVHIPLMQFVHSD